MSGTPVNRQVNIYINQASAEKSLAALQKSADKITQSIKKTEEAGEKLNKNIAALAAKKKDVEGLTAEAERLAAEIQDGFMAGQDMTQQMERLARTKQDIHKLTVEADALKISIEKGKRATQDLVAEQEKLGRTKEKIEELKKMISGEMAPSFNMIKTRVSELRRELAAMSQDAPGYAEKFNEFEKVSARFNEMRDALNNAGKETETFWDKVKEIALGTFIGNTAEAIMEHISGYLSGLISGNAQLSDSLADVRKATGLTDDAVKQLNSSLSKIDTRTATADLRSIAEGLGQIGQAATPEAVASIDKIVVALGDEFGGGAKEITTTLGILRNNLQDIKTGDYGNDVLRLGNALNVLGAEGLATAPVVVDFANRMAGIAITFKATSGQILGLSATLQELGIPAERGSTAITKLLQKVTTETDTYARVAKFAGISGKDFANLVNTDVVAALQKVAEGARIAGKDNITFGKVLKDLDADGSGAGEVLSKLASNSELLNSKISLSSKALKDTSSITDEFNLKNTNMAANLAKLEKAFAKVITSRAVNEFLSGAVEVALKFINVISAIPDWIEKNRRTFALFVGVLGLYISAKTRALQATLLLNAATFIENAQTIAVTVAKTAYGIVVDILTGRIFRQTAATTAATVAQRLYNLTLAANPLGVLITLLTTAYIAYQTFAQKVRLAAAEVEASSLLYKKQTEIQAEMVNRLRDSVNGLNSERIGYEQKKKILDALISQSPEYLQGLTMENLKQQEGIDIIRNYIRHLKELANAKALASVREDAQKKVIQLQMEFNEAADKANEQAAMQDNQWDTYFFAGAARRTDRLMEEAEEKRKELFRQEKIVATLDKNKSDQIDRSTKEMERQNKLLDKLKKAGKQNTDEYRQAIRELQTAQDTLNELTGVTDTPKAKTDVPDYTSATDDKKATAEARKAENRRKAQEKALRAWTQQFNQMRAEINAAEESQDAKQIQQVKEKYERLAAEANEYFIKYKQHIADAAGLSALERQELELLYQKQFESRSDKEYKSALQYASDYYNKEKQQLIVSYEQKAVTKEEYKHRVTLLEKEEAEQRARIAGDYAANSKQAAKDAEASKTKAVEEGIEDRFAKEKAANERKLDVAQLKVAISPKGSDAELKAKEQLLKLQFELETQYMDKTSEEYKLRQQNLNKELSDLDRQHLVTKLQMMVDTFSQIGQVASSYFNFLNTRDQQDLEKDRQSNDTKKKALQKRYDAGRISKAAYDRQVEALDQEYDKKAKELKIKEFKRNKAMQLANAAMGVAQAVIVALSGGPITGQILAGITAALGAIQIGIIAGTKPPEFAKGRRPVKGKGGVPDGPSHENDGIKLIDSQTGEVVGEMEGDEPILSTETYNNNRELIDRLLDASMYEGGRTIQEPQYLYTQPAPLNTGKVQDTFNQITIYRNGGFTGNAPQATSVATSSEQVQLPIGDLIDVMDKLQAVLKDGVTAPVYWNEIDRKNKQMKLLESTSSFTAV